MIPLDSPHAWDAHGRAWEVIHSRGTPSLPTGCPTATRGDSVATTDDAQNTTTRPPPRAPRLPRDALGSLSTPHMLGWRPDHQMMLFPMVKRCGNCVVTAELNVIRAIERCGVRIFDKLFNPRVCV